MRWFRDINAILEQEPETWLVYLYGQQLENIPHLVRKKKTFPRLISPIIEIFFDAGS